MATGGTLHNYVKRTVRYASACKRYISWGHLIKKASAAASSGYWLGPPLIRACVLLPFSVSVPRRHRPAAAGAR